MDKITFPFFYRCFARIDLQAISDNFDNLRKKTDPKAKVCSVVKADAYGHGSVQVAHLLEPKTDFFAVATIEEAVVLRQSGIAKPILILGYTSPMQYPILMEYDITPVVYNLEEAKELGKVALEHGLVRKMHIAVDTGMGRIGFYPCPESADIVKEITKIEGIELEGMFSHYAKADCADKESANKQTERFEYFISLLEERGVNIPIKHICNTAGVIEFDKHFDMVRYGISLYGMYPSDEVDKSRVKLTPAMSVYAHVAHIKEVEEGTGIGYGHVWVAPEKRKIATVTVGYADGYNRCITGKGWVLINGQKAPIRGRVCMDQIMVDITDIDDVEVGDVVVLMGKYGDEEISAETFGALTESFDYEVTCTFLPRVKRYYF